MSNPTELPDLDLNELEAIALAATPGPWKGDRYDGTIKYDLLGKDDETVIHGDNGNSDHGPFGIESEEDANYLLAFHPATALRLIELARRAQPEGEAPQAEVPWQKRLRQNDATLSLLCGVQHAESGAASGQVQYSAPITVTSMTLRKREFLEKKGYSVVGYVMQDAKQDRCTVAHGKVEWQVEQRAAQLDGGKEGSE